MIAIVDYRAGNLTSVRLAFEALQAPAIVTRAPDAIAGAARVVFPGVGAAGAAMANLKALGLAEPLREAARRGTPFLGICLGAQALFDFLEEDGGVPGLGLLPGTVRKFAPADRRDKVPQIGWNAVRWQRPHSLCAGIESGSEFYFVHSYYIVPARPEDTLGATDYAGVSFTAMAARGNLAAAQFHPEKSGRIGLQLLKNFIRWTPHAD